MNCLVTGGAGFIGSHLVELLIRGGHSVKVLDNFCTGRRENLLHIKTKKLRIYDCDVSDPVIPLERHFRGIDWVFHLAARADIVPSIVDPDSYHKSNVDGTARVLQASRTNKVTKFVYTASASCYGIPRIYPTPEEAPIQPQYPYALTKYVGELYVMHWAKVYKMPAISLRLFNVYGPRSRTSGTYGAVFGTFLAQKLAGKPFTVVGDGMQSRDFTYVTDVVNALVVAAKSSLKRDIFNVGTGKSQSVNLLVKLLDGSVVHIPKRPGEPDKTQADISKIAQKLHWKPRIEFSQGVKELLQNINYWRNAPVWTPQKIEHATTDWFKYLKST